LMLMEKQKPKCKFLFLKTSIIIDWYWWGYKEMYMHCNELNRIVPVDVYSSCVTEMIMMQKFLDRGCFEEYDVYVFFFLFVYMWLLFHV
jgi:hypothetical protein